MAVSVTIGGIAATNVQKVSDTEIHFTTPAHAAGNAEVVITVDGASASFRSFIYDAPPIVPVAVRVAPDGTTTLVDATGAPLAGRTVDFTLGTQAASAVTDANGKAVTELKLNQKNGTYTVAATWTPTGGDDVRYLGSSAATTFKLQAK